MSTTKVVRRAGAGVLACFMLLGLGCSGGADAAFWDAYRVQSQGLEQDPPQSLADLAERSDLIVVGTVAAVVPGKTYDQDPFRQATVNVTISPSQSRGDARGRPLVVEWDASPSGEATVDPPKGQYIFFLDHHPDFDTLICASVPLCVVAVDSGGQVSTPLSPGRVKEFPQPPAKYANAADLYARLAG